MHNIRTTKRVLINMYRWNKGITHYLLCLFILIKKNKNSKKFTEACVLLDSDVIFSIFSNLIRRIK